MAEKLLTVRVDADLYARAIAGKPRGWVSDAVRTMLEREVESAAEPALIDFGGEAAPETAETPKHTFRRGKVLDARWVKGVEEKLYACADECGLERWV